jgi:arylsulfatase
VRFPLPALLGLSLLALACTRAERAPHIVLITADSLRADHLSGFGYPRATSPTLDAFAEIAWSFRQAVTVIPKTAPSFATMFTGRHPREHGVGHNFARIPASAPVLAEALQAAGYRTAAFVSNPALRRASGFARGFDIYEEVERELGVANVLRAYIEWAGAESWDAPTFVWLHFIDPHGPYAPPARYEAMFLDDEWAQSPQRVRLGYELGATKTPNKVLGAVPLYQQRADGEDRVARYVARYDAEIRYVDDAFARVLSDLEDHERADDSVIVFTSDHGESLGEHDYYFEHGWFAFEPTLHIPLFIRTPGQTEGRRVEAPVSTLDLRPTLLALAGLTDDAPGRGRNLLAKPEAKEFAVVVENGDAYPHKTFGLRTDRWKYLRSGETSEELYDLADDPGETANRIERERTARDELRQALRHQLRALEGSALETGGETRDDPATLERLRELGYVR